jgi:RNA polymerase sigma factor (sigma-70 family)
MKVDEFTILLDRLKASDEDAWLSVKSHIGIIICSWAKREKIELDWVASAEGTGSAGSVPMEVYNRFREELFSGMMKAESFSDYKEAVYLYTKEILEDQFPRFYNLIRTRDNTAWQRVYGRLYIIAARWLSDRNIKAEVARDIYQESVVTFFEKVTVKELRFETSRDFKSYYFRILELKTMEGSRKRMLHNQRWLEIESSHLFGSIPEDGYESDDKYFLIEKIMHNSISRDEKFILKHYYFHREKLSEIAKALSISDGSCRQKKLQALRKIAAIYQQTEFSKQRPQ